MLFRSLYQGARPPHGNVLRRSRVDALVLCAQEYQPAALLFPGVQVLYAPLDDAELTAGEWEIAKQASKRVEGIIKTGGRVLVTCMQGLNRSGLVVAMTLHRLTGLPGHRCVEAVQARRANALMNESFVHALAGLR